jgi:hypothetical protein
MTPSPQRQPRSFPCSSPAKLSLGLRQRTPFPSGTGPALLAQPVSSRIASQREVLFAFPPSALLNRFVAKARSDGILAVVVVPLAVSKLLWASVVDNEAGYIRPRKQARLQRGR